MSTDPTVKAIHTREAALDSELEDYIAAGLYRRDSGWDFEPVNLYTRGLTGNLGRAHSHKPAQPRGNDPEVDEGDDSRIHLSTRDTRSYIQTLFKRKPVSKEKPPKKATPAAPASKPPSPPRSPPSKEKSPGPGPSTSSTAAPQKVKAIKPHAPTTGTSQSAGNAASKKDKKARPRSPTAGTARGSSTATTPKKAKNATPRAPTTETPRAPSPVRTNPHPGGTTSRETPQVKAKVPTAASSGTPRRPSTPPIKKEAPTPRSRPSHGNGPGTGTVATTSRGSKSDRSRTPPPTKGAPINRSNSPQRPVHTTDPRGVDRRPSLGSKTSPAAKNHGPTAPQSPSGKPLRQPSRSGAIDPAIAAKTREQVSRGERGLPQTSSDGGHRPSGAANTPTRKPNSSGPEPERGPRTGPPSMGAPGPPGRSQSSDVRGRPIRGRPQRDQSPGPSAGSHIPGTGQDQPASGPQRETSTAHGAGSSSTGNHNPQDRPQTVGQPSRDRRNSMRSDAAVKGDSDSERGSRPPSPKQPPAQAPKKRVRFAEPLESAPSGSRPNAVATGSGQPAQDVEKPLPPLPSGPDHGGADPAPGPVAGPSGTRPDDTPGAPRPAPPGAPAEPASKPLPPLPSDAGADPSPAAAPHDPTAWTRDPSRNQPIEHLAEPGAPPTVFPPHVHRAAAIDRDDEDHGRSESARFRALHGQTRAAVSERGSRYDRNVRHGGSNLPRTTSGGVSTQPIPAVRPRRGREAAWGAETDVNAWSSMATSDGRSVEGLDGSEGGRSAGAPESNDGESSAESVDGSNEGSGTE